MLNMPKSASGLVQFNSSCPTLWPATRNCHSVENARSNKNVISLRLKMLRVCYSLNWMGQAVPSFRPNMGKNSVRQTSAELWVVHNGESWLSWSDLIVYYYAE